MILNRVKWFFFLIYRELKVYFIYKSCIWNRKTILSIKSIYIFLQIIYFMNLSLIKMFYSTLSNLPYKQRVKCYK